MSRTIPDTVPIPSELMDTVRLGANFLGMTPEKYVVDALRIATEQTLVQIQEAAQKGTGR